jgi:hypothetical protein
MNTYGVCLVGEIFGRKTIPVRVLHRSNGTEHTKEHSTTTLPVVDD